MSPPSARAAFAVCAIAFLGGGILRALPVTGDLWLDEIWSWFLARDLSSPLEVFTRIHHSNNNHLTTLFFYAVGESGPWWLYRVPSLVLGTLTVAFAAMVALRWGRLEAAYAAVLTAACYALVHFSSEARGYAPAVGFALAAWWALDRALARERGGAALVFGASCALGLLSHLVFVFFWAGAGLQSAARLWRSEGSAGTRFARLASLHALPLATLAALYWTDLRFFRVLGGYPTDFSALTARTVGFSLGLPLAPALALPYLLLVAAVLALGLTWLRRDRDDAWILLAVTIALAPASVFGATRPQVVAVRYFLIGIACFLVLTSFLLARLHRSGEAGRATALALVALFVFGNGVHIAGFLRHGRGGYHEALQMMARETEGPGVVIGADHDHRVGMVLRYYARFLPQDKALVYLRRDDWPARGPDWLVVHAQQRPEALGEHVSDPEGNRYRLAGAFDHAAISGLFWAVYRNENVSPDRSAAGSRPRSPGP